MWQNTIPYQQKTLRTPKGSISMTAIEYQREHVGKTATSSSPWVRHEVAHPQDNALWDSHGSLAENWA